MWRLPLWRAIVGAIVKTVGRFADAVAGGPRQVRAATTAKILTFDIERRPGVYLSWDSTPKFLNRGMQLIRSSTISWAAKWYDHGETLYADIDHGETMFTQPEDVRGYREMLQGLSDLLDEADIVVGYNSARFDEPKIRGEFVRLGIREPSPFRTLDLIKTTRRMGWDYRSLAETASAVGIPDDEAKTSHQGFSLWTDCLNGRPEAWALMEEYNRQDVVLTERVMDRLRPYIKDHPNLGLWAGTDQLGNPVPTCPKCGSEDLKYMPGKTARTAQTGYGLLECGDCGARDTRANFIKERISLRTVR